MNGVVIGKRVRIGAVFTSIAAVLTHLDPENGPVYVGAAVPVTFIAQVLWAKYMGVTTE